MTLIGTAFHDEEHGPYLETDETIVFITELDAWPDDAIGQTVTVRGMMTPFVIQDEGETLRATQLELESWSRSDKVESIEEDPDSEIPATLDREILTAVVWVVTHRSPKFGDQPFQHDVNSLFPAGAASHSSAGTR